MRVSEDTACLPALCLATLVSASAAVKYRVDSIVTGSRPTGARSSRTGTGHCRASACRGGHDGRPLHHETWTGQHRARRGEELDSLAAAIRRARILIALLSCRMTAVTRWGRSGNGVEGGEATRALVAISCAGASMPDTLKTSLAAVVSASMLVGCQRVPAVAVRVWAALTPDLRLRKWRRCSVS